LLSVLGQFNDPFAEAKGQLKASEEVEAQKTVHPTFWRQIMAENF
jgi:hypothetical protein